MSPLFLVLSVSGYVSAIVWFGRSLRVLPMGLAYGLWVALAAAFPALAQLDELWCSHNPAATARGWVALAGALPSLPALESLGLTEQEFFDKFLAERIKDDLKSEKVLVRKAGQPFLHAFNAGPEFLDKALGLEAPEPVEDCPFLKNLVWNAMQLQEVEAFQTQFLIGVQDRLAQVGLTVSVGIDLAAGLGGYGDPRAVIAQEAADQLFAATRAVYVGSIKEIGTAVSGCKEDVVRLFGIERTEVDTAELPASQADLPYFESVFTKCARFHARADDAGAGRQWQGASACGGQAPG